jgi:hypothetical protein
MDDGRDTPGFPSPAYSYIPLQSPLMYVSQTKMLVASEHYRYQSSCEQNC